VSLSRRRRWRFIGASLRCHGDPRGRRRRRAEREGRGWASLRRADLGQQRPRQWANAADSWPVACVHGASRVDGDNGPVLNVWDALGRQRGRHGPWAMGHGPWLGEVWPGGGLLGGCEPRHAKMSLHTSGPSPRCSLPDTSPARHCELPLRRYRCASAASPVAPSFEKAPLLPPVSSARPRCYHCQCDGPPPRHSRHLVTRPQPARV
jgi:hypothetical protein